jgi:signal transduction histidine kinase
MTHHDDDHNVPRRPLHVTPAGGIGAPAPSASTSALAADAATARLVSVMHELNNLLDGATRTIILARESLGALALAPGADPAIAKRLDTVITSLEQMGTMLHAAMRPGGAVVLGDSQKTPLIEAISHAVESNLPRAAEHRIELVTTISPRLVLALAGPVYPVLANTIRNAIDAIAQSGLGSRIELIAELDTHHHAESQIQIDIVDDGPGLDEQSQQHAFEPGFSTKPKGFGVGLSLAKEIIRSLGGEITLEQRNPADPLRPGGRGAHIKIHYPLAS